MLKAQNDYLVIEPAAKTSLRLAEAGQETRFRILSAGPLVRLGEACRETPFSDGDVVHLNPLAVDRYPGPDGEVFVVRASEVFAKES